MNVKFITESMCNLSKFLLFFQLFSQNKDFTLISLDLSLVFPYHCYAFLNTILNNTSIAKHLPVNERIRVPTVRLIDHEDEQRGIMALEKALALAKEAELDLVMVAPNVNPPVCKIMDYGKHLYKEKKVERKHRASQKKSEVKGIRLSLRTGEHDLEVKLKRARRFLEDRHSLKIQLIFKGREIAHIDLATQKMLTFVEKLKDVAITDNHPKRQGHTLFMTLSPIK